MKKLFFVFILVSFIASATCAKPKLMSKKVVIPLPELASNCNRKIDISTKQLYFFTTMREFGHLTIAKGDGLYYLMIAYIAFPHYEDFAGSIHLLLSNGEKLKLFVCGKNLDLKGNKTDIVYVNPDYKSSIGINTVKPFGSISIPGNRITYCLYEISRDDLEKISENDINTIIIDYSLGNMVYDTQVGKRKYHKIAAKSILEI